MYIRRYLNEIKENFSWSNAVRMPSLQLTVWPNAQFFQWPILVLHFFCGRRKKLERLHSIVLPWQRHFVMSFDGFLRCLFCRWLERNWRNPSLDKIKGWEKWTVLRNTSLKLQFHWKAWRLIDLVSNFNPSKWRNKFFSN